MTRGPRAVSIWNEDPSNLQPFSRGAPGLGMFATPPSFVAVGEREMVGLAADDLVANGGPKAAGVERVEDPPDHGAVSIATRDDPGDPEGHPVRLWRPDHGRLLGAP